MTKKRAVPAVLPSTVQRYFWVGLKVVAAVSILICVIAFLKISQSSQSGLAAADWRYFSGDEVAVVGNPKVAFLFLARADLPLDFLWHAFFMNGDVANFSIYIHSAPDFVFDQSTTRSPFFYGRQLRRSVQVAWGESSMIEGEQLLFRTALNDPANRRFVLLSDSCIPLYNFSYIYDYLMSSSKSFVDSFIDTKEQRYNPKMSPNIPKEKWRKGSQWITLTRKHSEVVMADGAVFPVFKKHCKRRPEIDPGKRQDARPVIQKEHNCIPDEHYIQTLFSMNNLENELERRTLTYTSWNQSTNKMEKQGWHPFTFDFANAGPQRIKEIKDINHVYYDTEFRTEWCQKNSTFVPCFLFARKFSKGAAMRLLREGLVGPFDVATLLLTHSNPSA